jgi:hypothetical protein
MTVPSPGVNSAAEHRRQKNKNKLLLLFLPKTPGLAKNPNSRERVGGG